jgi:peptide/nickel transport system permease protein
MLNFVLKRLLTIIPTLLIVSFISFAVIQLQPTSFIDVYLDDPRFSPETVERLKIQYGLDQHWIVQYFNWLWGVVSRFDFGYSFVNNRPATGLITEYLWWTIEIAGISLIFSWLVAVPLGIFTAVRKNGFTDAIASFFGYVGLAVPDFLLVYLLFGVILATGGTNVGGLFSNDFIDAPWSWARVVDHLNHLWPAVLVFGLSHIASLQRQMRASVLDVLGQDYVRTARSKGLKERVVVYRHAVRNAINPLVSSAGLSLSELVSGTLLGAIVMNLPTIGKFMYDSLIAKDQFVVMSILLLTALLLMIGNLLADVALAYVDPRIRYD